MCPHIDANWTDHGEAGLEVREDAAGGKEGEERERERGREGGEVAIPEQEGVPCETACRGNKRLLESSRGGEEVAAR